MEYVSPYYHAVMKYSNSKNIMMSQIDDNSIVDPKSASIFNKSFISGQNISVMLSDNDSSNSF